MTYPKKLYTIFHKCRLEGIVPASTGSHKIQHERELEEWNIYIVVHHGLREIFNRSPKSNGGWVLQSLCDLWIQDVIISSDYHEAITRPEQWPWSFLRTKHTA